MIINRDQNYKSNLSVVLLRDNSVPEVLDLESNEKSSVIIDTTGGHDRLGVAVVCSSLASCILEMVAAGSRPTPAIS